MRVRAFMYSPPPDPLIPYDPEDDWTWPCCPDLRGVWFSDFSEYVVTSTPSPSRYFEPEIYLKATRVSDGRVSLAWNRPPNAEVVVERSINGGEFVEIAVTGGYQYTDANTDPQQLYTYRVRAAGMVSNVASPEDDPGPQRTVSISDAAVVEGDNGSKAMNFNVWLSSASTQDITVGYGTQDGTATTLSTPRDYRSTSGILTFKAGETVKTITIFVNGDRLFEPDETFSVVLSHSYDVEDGKLIGVGTIINDDEPGNHAPIVINEGLPIFDPTPTTVVEFDDSVTVIATVRDFKKDRPDDFQASITGWWPGLVSPTLGPDRKPTFVAGKGKGSIASTDSFYEWFHDVEGNMRGDTATVDGNSVESTARIEVAQQKRPSIWVAASASPSPVTVTQTTLSAGPLAGGGWATKVQMPTPNNSDRGQRNRVS